MVYFQVLSQIGTIFTSSFWNELMSLKLKLSTTYHPQTDGQTECVNQCIEKCLQNFCLYQQDNWVDWIGLAKFQYNNLIHDSTHISPFFANYGFHPLFSFSPIQKSNVPAASQFIDHLSSIQSELQAELKLTQDTAKCKYNIHCSPAPIFSPGDLIMLSHHNIKTTHPSNKFNYHKLGLYKILHSVGSLMPIISNSQPPFHNYIQFSTSIYLNHMFNLTFQIVSILLLLYLTSFWKGRIHWTLNKFWTFAKLVIISTTCWTMLINQSWTDHGSLYQTSLALMMSFLNNSIIAIQNSLNLHPMLLSPNPRLLLMILLQASFILLPLQTPNVIHTSLLHLQQLCWIKSPNHIILIALPISSLQIGLWGHWHPREEVVLWFNLSPNT